MAVYTELTQAEVADFLQSYDLPVLASAEGIRSGVENTNYRLTLKDGRRYILTLFEKRVAEADLPFFTSLMEHLALKGVPCPRPIHARDGEMIKRVKDRPAVIVAFLEGKSVSATQNIHLTGLGANMAHMHLAARGFGLARPNALGLQGWQEILDKITGRADEIVPGLSVELQNEMEALAASWPESLPQGVIHADLFTDNVFYGAEGRLTGFIDFYFACNDFFSYDLAICLNAWCFERQFDFNITKAQYLLRAYNEVRPFSDAERTALPVLARGAAFRFLLTRAHDWLYPVKGALVTPKDPLEYLKKLRFHRSITHYSHYGL